MNKSSTSIVNLLSDYEKLIEQTPGQVVLMIRYGDRIIIRDNSGIIGLTGDELMQKCLALLEELFQTNPKHKTT